MQWSPLRPRTVIKRDTNTWDPTLALICLRHYIYLLYIKKATSSFVHFPLCPSWAETDRRFGDESLSELSRGERTFFHVRRVGGGRDRLTWRRPSRHENTGSVCSSQEVLKKQSKQTSYQGLRLLSLSHACTKWVFFFLSSSFSFYGLFLRCRGMNRPGSLSRKAK